MRIFLISLTMLVLSSCVIVEDEFDYDYCVEECYEYSYYCGWFECEDACYWHDDWTYDC